MTTSKSKTKTGSILKNEKWSSCTADNVTGRQCSTKIMSTIKNGQSKRMNEKWKRCIEDDRNGPKENESNMIDEKTTNHHNYLIIFMKTFIHDAFHTQYSCLGVVKEYIGSC